MTLPESRGPAQRLCAPLVAVVACASGACVRQLPPAPIPAPTLPPGADAGPPAAGRGRLIVDVVDGPAPVQRVQMRATPLDHGRGRRTFQFSEGFEPLCPQSPCVAEVPAGTNVLLGFPVLGDSSDTEVELVHVGPETSVYRRALSVYSKRGGGGRVFGILATVFGSASLITGTALLPAGLSRDNSGMTAAGGITLGAGALLLTVGIIALRATADVYQPGSSNHFAP